MTLDATPWRYGRVQLSNGARHNIFWQAESWADRRPLAVDLSKPCRALPHFDLALVHNRLLVVIEEAVL